MWNDGSLGADDYLINVSGMDLQGNKKTNIQGDIVSKGKK
jgi:filamentous hemagglutinin family protein